MSQVYVGNFDPKNLIPYNSTNMNWYHTIHHFVFLCFAVINKLNYQPIPHVLKVFPIDESAELDPKHWRDPMKADFIDHPTTSILYLPQFELVCTWLVGGSKSAGSKPDIFLDDLGIIGSYFART